MARPKFNRDPDRQQLDALDRVKALAAEYEDTANRARRLERERSLAFIVARRVGCTLAEIAEAADTTVQAIAQNVRRAKRRGMIGDE